MKKITLLVAMAICGFGFANAQYVVDPSIDQVTAKGDQADIFDAVILDATTISNLQAAGKTVNNFAADEISRHWYLWAGLRPADGAYPGVDMHFDGYISLEVIGDAGWSGGGLTVDKPGIDLSHITKDTRLHIAMRSPSSTPDNVGLILFNGEEWGSIPAKFTVGKSAFNDNGVMFPVLADFDRDGGDWVGIDISLADIKKFWPSFDFKSSKTWNGNILSFIAGNVAGKNFSIDALYLYTAKGAGVNDVTTDNVELVITANTINAAGVSRIELYNIAGQIVKTADSSVLGIDDVAAGVYIVKADSTVKKVVIK